ncbi:transporter substrate-binding domain-containing protein [Mediterraneibacter glycyrrhizinilyticus]|nr:transporter substrate-binding domain-containing protein [Mediterraneibacter glycyrrhizinilyticus]MBM6802200.1 transporter substrate-binding domain-containing protein [Mediterraneibacter glycyrrhizinilyticus]
MKKLLAAVLTAALTVGMLAGCGGSDSGSDNGGSSSGSDAGSAKTAKVIDVDLTNEEYAFGVDKSQPELLEQVNAFIAKIQEDGTLDEIFDKYFGGGEPTPVESAELDTSKDQLVVATNAAFEPFEYMEGENYVGIDMEIAALLAEELGQELVIQNMDFDAVCLSVGQQKCDIAMAGLTVSEDRKEYVTFSDTYYQASQRLIVPSDDTAFDDMTDADTIAAALGELDSSVLIGCQQGTTGNSYIEGSDDLGFPGLNVTCKTYKNGSLAVQDMLNGNIDYVIIDAAPAAAITESINEMQ